MNLLSEFRFDILGIELEEDAFASFARRIHELDPFFDFATSEETNAKSGQRVGVFFGYSASYVAITPRVPGAHKDYTIGLQATRTGLLSEVRTALEQISVPFGYVTAKLYGPNGESMDWYHSIEPAPGGTEIPVFLNEYATDYLEDIGLSNETRDQIGRSEDGGKRTLFSEVMLELSEQALRVIRHLSGVTDEQFTSHEVRLPIRDRSSLVVVPARDSVLREFRLPTKLPGNFDLGAVDSWSFEIVDGVLVGRRAA